MPPKADNAIKDKKMENKSDKAENKEFPVRNEHVKHFKNQQAK